VVGDADADAYRRFAGWAAAGVALLGQTEHGPPPTLRELAALAEAALGPQADRFLQALLGSASNLVRSVVADERLQAPLAHWAAHSQQSPADPGTGAGALLLAGGHGRPAARPASGSRALVDALVRCLEAAGGRLHCGLAGTRVEVAGGRAVAVQAGGERFAATRAVVSSLDARRLLLELVDPGAVPPWLAAEAGRIHVGRRNVSELKVDATLAAMPPLPGPPGFDRAFLLSANTTGDLERAFASIQLGELPERPPLMLAFPSALEDGWAPPGRAAAFAAARPHRRYPSKLPPRGSSQLVQTHDRLCLEDLAVANLMTNRHLARAIGDAAWAELARQLGYKAAWFGAELVACDRWFPSTKTCSRCGLVKQQMGLAERVFYCGGCGLVIDRDRNAAANLAVWAERHHAQAPDRQAGGRATNAPGGEGAGRRPGDGGTDPSEGGTDAHAVAACAEDTRAGCCRPASPRGCSTGFSGAACGARPCPAARAR
jgi:IS605 OrfB family transposase